MYLRPFEQSIEAKQRQLGKYLQAFKYVGKGNCAKQIDIRQTFTTLFDGLILIDIAMRRSD
jgi:hypothetical protein